MTRITQYRLPNWEPIERIVPNTDFLEKSYRYVAKPLHVVLPKPNEFGFVIDYLLTEKETVPTDTTGAVQYKQDLSGFLSSGVLFIAMMMMCGCLYIWRTEF